MITLEEIRSKLADWSKVNGFDEATEGAFDAITKPTRMTGRPLAKWVLIYDSQLDEIFGYFDHIQRPEYYLIAKIDSSSIKSYYDHRSFQHSCLP